MGQADGLNTRGARRILPEGPRFLGVVIKAAGPVVVLIAVLRRAKPCEPAATVPLNT